MFVKFIDISFTVNMFEVDVSLIRYLKVQQKILCEYQRQRFPGKKFLEEQNSCNKASNIIYSPFLFFLKVLLSKNNWVGIPIRQRTHQRCDRLLNILCCVVDSRRLDLWQGDPYYSVLLKRDKEEVGS